MSAKLGTASSQPEQFRLVPPDKQFTERESRELIIAYCGPIGSGTQLVIEETKKLLEAAGYAVETLKLSTYIKTLYQKHITNTDAIDLTDLTPANRYERLQDAGNQLRRHFQQQDLLAQLAISKIAIHRQSEHGDTPPSKLIPTRQAYLIDQLKRPEEAKLLRMVYGNLFYLVGVLCAYDQRKDRLVNEVQLTAEDAERIMQRDQKESDEHGQQLDKALELADYFIRNTHSNRNALDTQIERFIDLIHGKNGVTPTQHEYAMYVAHAAGARSACLSRQVGAAITTKNGNVISTGCNDVPKAGGGLYSEADGPNDKRCINKEGGKCFNDAYKHRLLTEIRQTLEKTSLSPAESTEVASIIYKSTRLKDLLEFSRSIHAEMDAITTVARDGAHPLRECYLYTTVFPCHNCARHIIASGINRVYFIQPYEKSLATALHGDDIELDPGESNSDSKKTQFIHFEGVAPRQYLTFFHAQTDRKDDAGKAMGVLVPRASKVSAQYLDRYMDLETKVLEYVSQKLSVDSNSL